jgi:hypothetical protein
MEVSTAAPASTSEALAMVRAGLGYLAPADPTALPARARAECLQALEHRTRVTKGAARGHLGWARRAVAHPQVVAALAEGQVLTDSDYGNQEPSFEDRQVTVQARSAGPGS